jgi:hypothetical protein
MRSEMYRHLTPEERKILDRLLEPDFPGKNAFAEQVRNCTVREIDEDGSLEFGVVGGPIAGAVKYAVPTEAEAEDVDGVVIHFLLHARDGKVKQLEVYKEDGTRVRQIPTANQLRVFAPQ